jgi:hypothetical protein
LNNEKAKHLKDPEKKGRDKGKEGIDKEGRRTESLSAISLVTLQLRRIILFIGTTPFFSFPKKFAHQFCGMF